MSAARMARVSCTSFCCGNDNRMSELHSTFREYRVTFSASGAISRAKSPKGIPVFEKTYHATHPEMMECVDNESLRDRYLVGGMFESGKVVLKQP